VRVVLSGYNVDSQVIGELAEESGRKDVTPETISAAYARISRDPRPVDELRSIARREVEKARKSNRKIIFDMGHHSVAEHAVFNFDIIGVSRLAIEQIERFRLCSFTEKSQRYITLEDEFVIPPEIGGSHIEKRFVDTVEAQNSLYHKIFSRLKEEASRSSARPAGGTEQERFEEGMAKEDARYVTSLATAGQLGETVNARNLELMLRRFASHELAEVREIGRRMYDSVADVAPSVIIFRDANEYDQKTYPELRSLCAEWVKDDLGRSDDEAVRLVDYTRGADAALVAALLHTSTDRTYSECKQISEEMQEADRMRVVKTALERMELYDAALREFEYVHMAFEVVVSASCFAQLKRHRMATITAQAYDPDLGIMIPDSVKDSGMEKEFASMAERSEETYYMLLDQAPSVAQYVLTNSHRRRVLLGLNARELYHISRLREDSSAQWEIRGVTARMIELARGVMPVTMLLAGGKDSYPRMYEMVYGRPPRVVRPELPS
jgi:flavin-dependent thymidylate synthase